MRGKASPPSAVRASPVGSLAVATLTPSNSAAAPAMPTFSLGTSASLPSTFTEFFLLFRG